MFAYRPIAWLVATTANAATQKSPTDRIGASTTTPMTLWGHRPAPITGGSCVARTLRRAGGQEIIGGRLGW